MINLILSVEEASQTAERATKNIVNAYWFSHAFFNDCFEHLVLDQGRDQGNSRLHTWSIIRLDRSRVSGVKGANETIL